MHLFPKALNLKSDTVTWLATIFYRDGKTGRCFLKNSSVNLYGATKNPKCCSSARKSIEEKQQAPQGHAMLFLSWWMTLGRRQERIKIILTLGYTLLIYINILLFRLKSQTSPTDCWPLCASVCFFFFFIFSFFSTVWATFTGNYFWL